MTRILSEEKINRIANSVDRDLFVSSTDYWDAIIQELLKSQSAQSDKQTLFELEEIIDTAPTTIEIGNQLIGYVAVLKQQLSKLAGVLNNKKKPPDSGGEVLSEPA